MAKIVDGETKVCSSSSTALGGTLNIGLIVPRADTVFWNASDIGRGFGLESVEMGRRDCDRGGGSGVLAASITADYLYVG